ncbi:MAG: hypothetical protein M3Y13_01695, partial [Armatimonadota bacterium]|nr:hypothetical protein [Armatimonadota bacterium]
YDPATASPAPGKLDVSGFAKSYLQSGLIADARKNGITTLLLGPDHVPPYMLQNPADHSSRIKNDQIGAYAALLAEIIRQVNAQGAGLDATGVANEPPWFDAAQMVTAVKDLRVELDRRGLKRIQIVAPENSNNDGTTDDYLKALKADPAAWKALEGIATHSYNMASRPEEAAIVKGTGKEFWITEAGGGGISLPTSEQPIDGLEAASMASRVLNDMNHRVTRWVWFIGVMDVRHYPVDFDNVQRLIEFQPDRPADWYLPLLKYYYLRRLSQTFDSGAVFRQSSSSLEGDMTYTYGRKPHLNAAGGRNPDGTWGLALSNFTSNAFVQDTPLNKDNSGYPSQIFTVTIRVPELAQSGDVPFQLSRNSETLRDIDEGIVTMHNGTLTVSIAPLELVTLRSTKGLR